MNKPFLIIIFSFVCVILVGAILLYIPLATIPGRELSIVEALFISTSSVCLAGLNPISYDINFLSTFGELIVISLIQIGGLGLVTISIAMLSLIKGNVGINNYYLAKNSLNLPNIKGALKIIRFALIVTLLFELLGSLINFFILKEFYPNSTALKLSIYHAISTFNNAGVEFFPGNSLLILKNNIIFNLNSAFLIFSGGIGFITLFELIKRDRLSTHSKIVFKTSIFLIIMGMVLLKVVERGGVSWLQAFFNSVSLRTAGFLTVEMISLSNAAIIIILILMFIGASPSSTGGGIKTTTFYLSVKYIIYFATGKKLVIDNKKIAHSSFTKAFILISFSMLYIGFIIFLISYIESYVNNDANAFVQILLEVVSAFSTVGISFGITPNLHMLSKVLLIITMILGRLGPITIINAFNNRARVNIFHKIDYIEENIIIG